MARQTSNPEPRARRFSSMAARCAEDCLARFHPNEERRGPRPRFGGMLLLLRKTHPRGLESESRACPASGFPEAHTMYMYAKVDACNVCTRACVCMQIPDVWMYKRLRLYIAVFKQLNLPTTATSSSAIFAPRTSCTPTPSTAMATTTTATTTIHETTTTMTN